MKPFHVYILQCADGTFYTGHTDDLDQRMLQHSLGRMGYTASRRPVTLAWQGEFESREGALAFELQVKGWSRAKKQALMAGDWAGVQALAVSHGARGLRQAQPERDEAVGDGLRQAQPERGEAVGDGLRQAQPERELVNRPNVHLAPTPSVRPEPVEGHRPPVPLHSAPTPSVRPEPVEGHRPPVPLHSAPTPSVRPEPVEGHRPPVPLHSAPTPSVRPEPVEGHRPPVPLHSAPTPSVRPEPVEGHRPPVPLHSAPTPSVRPEPVEGHRPPVPLHSAPTPSVRPEPVEGHRTPVTLSQITAPSPAQRRAIAKAITLLESTRADHRAQADELLTALLPHTGNSFRLGISGVPGVGKSTFIEALGLYLIERGHRVAVLAVDPSSSISGGSILGDKTRMEHLSVNANAYIRPSPSSGTLGGVAAKTREAMLVCEAAGYDIVIVETVGVGQSETAVAGMTDLFVLMQLPNAGDDLQAIKKGVMELADVVVINKADIDPDAATRAEAQITSAMRLFSQHGREAAAHHARPRVLQLSALKNIGVDAFWHTVSQFRGERTQDGSLQARRKHQALAWMWERIESGLRQEFRQHAAVRAMLPGITHDVEAGLLPASTAARQLLQARQEQG